MNSGGEGEEAVIETGVGDKEEGTKDETKKEEVETTLMVEETVPVAAAAAAASSSSPSEEEEPKEEEASSPEEKDYPKLHLILEDCTLNDRLDEWIKKCDMYELGVEYGVVAVLGCQSSGKSTLLNLLFGTHFDTMEAQFGRSQTTKGIWLSRSKYSNTVVMDVEGTDGRERAEDTNFERKSSLFSLALAQILIVNIWMHDIGRWQGANYPLLRTVFELNLRLFQSSKKSRVQLLFTIRDHAFTPIEKLAEAIMQDLNIIWTQISKPDEFASSKASDFFDFQFFPLPPRPHQPQEFEAKALELGKRLNNRSHSDTLWSEHYSPDVPMDGFSTFCDNVWETVSANKDLGESYLHLHHIYLPSKNFCFFFSHCQ